MYTRHPRLQILVLRRPPSRGHIWQPVTGNVDPSDNSLVEAARRELAEETGIGHPLDVVDTQVDFTFQRGRAEVRERLIGVETGGPEDVVLSDEHVDYAWLPPDEAARRLEWEIHREGVRCVIDGVSGGRSTP